jgi:hypothetical protein
MEEMPRTQHEKLVQALAGVSVEDVVVPRRNGDIVIA